MYPTVTLFRHTMGTYGLCAITGLLLCGYIALQLGRSRQIPSYMALQAVTAAGIGLLLGRHLLYAMIQCITAPPPPDPSLTRLLSHYFGGAVYYGGFLGALAGVKVYTRSTMEHRAVLLDLFALLTPLFHTFDRIGCFLGGCCYGIPCRWGFQTDSNPLIPAVNGVYRFPVQLAEAVLNLCLFCLLLLLFRSGTQAKRLLGWYLLLYPFYRFGLEFLRGGMPPGASFWGCPFPSGSASCCSALLSIYCF